MSNLVQDAKEYNKSLSNQLTSIENRLNRGVLSLTDYNNEKSSVEVKMGDIKEFLDQLHRKEKKEEVSSSLKSSNDPSIKEEIEEYEELLSLDQEKKENFNTYKKYYSQGIYSDEEYLVKLKQLNPKININDEILLLQKKIEADAKKKSFLETLKDYHEKGIYTDEEYLKRLKELAVL